MKPLHLLLGTLIAVAILVFAAWPASAQQCVPRDEQVDEIAAHPRYISHQMLDPDQVLRAMAVVGVDDVPDVLNGIWIVLSDATSVLVVWRTDTTCGYIMATPQVGPAIQKAIRGTAA